MKVLIDIDEELYKKVVEHTKRGYIGSDVWIAVANGVPVSTDGDSISRSGLKKAVLEHHRSEIEAIYHFWYDDTIITLINNAPTVIEMEKPNCVTCDHFGKCEGCEKREEE